MHVHVTEDFISMALRCILTSTDSINIRPFCVYSRTSTIYCVTITSDVIWSDHGNFCNKIWKQCRAYFTTSSTYDTGHILSTHPQAGALANLLAWRI